MPEGPETKRMVDTINRDLVDKKIISTKFYHQSLDSIPTSGIYVKEVLSKGKAVVIRLNNDYSIITHNQLYGRWTSNSPRRAHPSRPAACARPRPCRSGTRSTCTRTAPDRLPPPP